MRILPLLLLLPIFVFAGPCEDLVAAFDNDAAADCYRQRLLDSPGDFDLRCKLARALIDAGEDAGGDAAEDWYRRAVELSEEMVAERPGDAKGHYYLAVAKGRNAQFLGGKEKVSMAHEIRASADRAIQLDPRHAEALLTRGIYFYELATLSRPLRFFARMLYGGLPEGGLDEAEADLEASRRLDSDNTNTLYTLALIRYEREDYEGCVALCRETMNQPILDHLDPVNQDLAADLMAKAERKLDRKRDRR